MKRTTALLLTLTAVLALSFTACVEDRDKVATMFSGFVTGYTDGQGYVTVIKNDFGDEYMVSEKTQQLKPDTLYRMVASLELDENKTAKVLQMVPTISRRAPVDSLVHDSLRVTDPVEIQSVYLGGGYLNIYLGVKVEKESSNHKLLYSRLTTPGKLTFTIYHNARGDRPVYTKHAYISIPLYGYGLAQNDTVFLSCKGYQEDYDYKLVVK